MRNMVGLRILIAALMILIMAQVAQAGDWPMYRHDEANTGATTDTVNPPIKLVWKFKTGNAIQSPPVIYKDIIYILSNDGYLYALDSLSGNLRWKFKGADNNTGSFASPAVYDGIVYFGTKEMFAVDAINGNLKWKKTLGSFISSSPVVSKGIVYVAVYGGYVGGVGDVYALVSSTGNVKWNFKTEAFQTNALINAPAVLNDIVYMPTITSVDAIDATNGKLKWRSYIDKSDKNEQIITPAVVSYGKVFVGSNNFIYAFDANDGNLIWKSMTNDTKVFIDSNDGTLKSKSETVGIASGSGHAFAVYGNKIYVSGKGNYVLDINNGIVQGQIDYYFGSNYVSASRDFIFLTSLGGAIDSLDLNTGTFKREFVNNYASFSSASISGGMLFVSSWDGYVYAFAPSEKESSDRDKSVTTSQQNIKTEPFTVFTVIGIAPEFTKGNFVVVEIDNEKYVAIKNNTQKLAKLIENQPVEIEKVLKEGEVWDIGDGWTLTLQAIDVKKNPILAWLILSYRGNRVDNKIVSQGQVYTYIEKSIADEQDVPTFVTYISNVSKSAVAFRYTWAVSKNIKVVPNKTEQANISHISTAYSPSSQGQFQDSLNWGLVGGILAVIAIGIVVLSLRRRESARTPEQSSRTGSDTLEAGYDIEHETPFPQYLPKADKLLVLRESEFFNGFIRIKLSVKNKMQYTVTDVFLDLDVDENILRFDHHEPETYDVKKEKVQLGNIPPDNDRTIALYLDPLICAKEGTDINARVDYKDAYGKPDSVRIRPLRIKVVCPIFQTEQDINIGRLKELVESLPAYGSKVFSLRKGIEIGEAAALCREVIQMHDVRHVRTFRTTDSKTYEIWYYGKTKVERIDLVIKANVSKETESIEVFVAAPDQKALTGLLAELGRNLTKRGESLGKLAPQVNLTIKGSIIQRSRLLDFCDFNGICGANVVIEDSLVQRSNIRVSRE